MNRACKFNYKNLHEQNIHASSIRPLKNNFVRIKVNVLILGLTLGIIPVTSCQSQQQKKETSNTASASKQAVEHLTTASFKQKVFNFDVNKEWKYAGDKPAIIDFYADWCGPCRIVAPTVAKIAEDYKGKINVYKVNVDNEQELASAFGVSGIPAILFIPMTDRPQMSTGVLSKEAFDKAIKDVLKVNL
jgi:thioredoxin 1